MKRKGRRHSNKDRIFTKGEVEVLERIFAQGHKTEAVAAWLSIRRTGDMRPVKPWASAQRTEQLNIPIPQERFCQELHAGYLITRLILE